MKNSKLRVLCTLNFLLLLLWSANCFGENPKKSAFNDTQHPQWLDADQEDAVEMLPATTQFDQYDFSEDFKRLMRKNRKIAEKYTTMDSQYFSRHAKGQTPKYMWIGCSDSRVIPEKILGLDVGEVFVHRNVANQANPVDQNVMSALQYAVDYLKIKTIIIAGHYECGGIKASLTNKDFGHLESWLSQIRQLRYRNIKLLASMPEKQRLNKLIEINVVEQARHLSRIPVIQESWRDGERLEIVGVVYDIKTGVLKSVMKPVNGFDDIPEAEEFIEFVHEEH